MKKMILWKTLAVLSAIVVGVCLVTPSLAETESELEAIEIYPPTRLRMT